MDSQSQELRVLERVRKRRRLSSLDEDSDNFIGTTGTTSRLSEFVQSAMRQKKPREVAGFRNHDSWSAMRSSSGKRRRIGASCELKKRLEAVRFPGYSDEEEEMVEEEEQEEEEADDIEVFSEIEEEELKEETKPERCHVPVQVRKRRRKKCGQNRSSNKLEPLRSKVVGEGGIQEFESCSSSDDSSSSPMEHPNLIFPSSHISTPIPLLISSPSHTSTPAPPPLPLPLPPPPHQPMTLTEFRSLIVSSSDHPSTSVAIPTPEYQSIVTPPTSPEATPLNQGSEIKQMTASEWMRKIALESTSEHGGSLTSGADETVLGLSESVLRRVRESGGGGKGGRGRRSTKMVEGGLAALAETVAQRESSEIAFWEHRARHMDDSTSDLSVCMVVEVCSVTSSHSLKVTSCKTSPPLTREMVQGREGGRGGRAGGGEGGGGGVEGRGEVEIVTVLFSARCAKFLDLQVGQTIRIHPPWQCLTSPMSGQKVILCTHFCVPITAVPPHSRSSPPSSVHPHHHLPTPTTSSSSSSSSLSSSVLRLCEATSGGLCQMRSPHRSSLSPNKFGAVSRRLFLPDVPDHLGDQASHSVPHPSTTTTSSSSSTTITSSTSTITSSTTTTISSQSNRGTLSTTSLPHNGSHRETRFQNHKQSDSLPPPPPPPSHHHLSNPVPYSRESGKKRVWSSLLEAMESSSVRGVLNLKCRVLRIFRRALPLHSAPVTLNEFTTTTKSNEVSSIKISHSSRWCVILCDATGLICELQLINFTHPTWTDVIRGGEGEVYIFRNIRVSARTNPSRNPELFSLIRFLSHQLAPASGQWCGGDGPRSIPSFCYILVSGPESVPEPCREAAEREDEMEKERNGLAASIPYLTPSASTSSIISTVSGHQLSTVGTRVHIYARVVHYQPEIPADRLHTVSLPPRHGHHLFVLAHLPIPPSSSSSSSHPHHQLLRLYIKPQFSREGVDHLLSLPGSRLLIRDVGLDNDRGKLLYSMDVCSMVHPRSNGELLPQDAVYPRYPFTDDEESILNQLPPPSLPLLSEDHSDTGSLVKLEGEIVGVDEESAFSWPECDSCGNAQLSTVSDAGKDEGLFCEECDTRVVNPSLHLQLSVYVQPHPHPLSSHVCVQLLQSSIKTLLPLSSASLDEGFDVKQVLNRSLYLNGCYVQGNRHNKQGQLVLYLQEIDTYHHLTQP